MGIVYWSNFAGGTATEWDLVTNALSPYAGYVQPGTRWGIADNCFLIEDISSVVKVLTAAKGYYFAFDFVFYTSVFANPLLQFLNGDVVIGVLGWNTNKLVARSQADVLLGTTTTSFPSKSTRKRIEVYFYSDLTNGRFQVKVNGTLEIDFAGKTSNAGDTIQGFRFGLPWGGNQPKYLIGSVIVRDDTWPGNLKALQHRITSSGALTQLTPSTGSNYECINANPHSTTKKVYGTVVDKTDCYTKNLLPYKSEIPAIIGLQVKTVSQVIGSVTPKNIVAGAYVSGSFREGTPTEPSYPMRLISNEVPSNNVLFTTNPATSGAWTVPVDAGCCLKSPPTKH
jgi:hypothetical protein